MLRHWPRWREAVKPRFGAASAVGSAIGTQSWITGGAAEPVITIPPRARTDTASRVIAASPERVCAAFIDLDALVAWLPPAECPAGLSDSTSERIRFQIRTVLSWPPEASQLPSPATVSAWTVPMWPVRMCVAVPAAGSQTRTVSSQPAEASQPSGAAVNARTQSVCP